MNAVTCRVVRAIYTQSRDAFAHSGLRMQYYHALLEEISYSSNIYRATYGAVYCPITPAQHSFMSINHVTILHEFILHVFLILHSFSLANIKKPQSPYIHVSLISFICIFTWSYVLSFWLLIHAYRIENNF